MVLETLTSLTTKVRKPKSQLRYAKCSFGIRWNNGEPEKELWTEKQGLVFRLRFNEGFMRQDYLRYKFAYLSRVEM